MKSVSSSAAILVVLALAGSASASGFSYANFDSVTGLNLVGSATVGPGIISESSTVSLTQPGQLSNAGAIWKSDKQDVGLGFQTDFKFRVRDRDNVVAADGFAFVIQNNSATALGGPGGALGYSTNPFGGTSGISNSLAVVFDSFDNNGAGFVQSGATNIVQVQSRGLLANVPTANGNLGVSGSIGAIADGSIKTVRIIYTPGIGLDIYYQNLASPVLTVNVDLGNQIALSGIQSWVGITSATGGAPQRHEILEWSFNGAIPTPASASLLGLGALVAARRRRAR
jgi:hypothetical protein